jgi:hypothetical protein
VHSKSGVAALIWELLVVHYTEMNSNRRFKTETLAFRARVLPVQSPVMNGGIRERVEALRQEIAEIQKLNLAYLQTPRADHAAMSAHARREQRLTEIMDELKSMTDWKRT